LIIRAHLQLVLLLGISLPMIAQETPLAAAEDVLRVASPAGLAGALIWPAPETIEGDRLAPGTVVIAARALLEDVLGPFAAAEPLLEPIAGGLAVGAEVPAGHQEELIEILSELAIVAPPPSPLLHEALSEARERARARAEDPLEQARLAALSALFPGFRGPWLAEGRVMTLSAVSEEGILEALDGLRQRPFALRIAGPAALERSVLARVKERVRPLPPVGASAPPAEHRGIVIYDDRPESGGQAALVVAARLDPSVVARTGVAVPLLLECLREGEGSLAQRLSVAFGAEADAWIEALWLGENGASVVLGVRVDAARAESSLSVLMGTIASIKTQPFRSDAVLRARQRLDRHAKAVLEDAGALLIKKGIVRSGWDWPPSQRWKSPTNAAKVRAAANDLFAPAGLSRALAGPVGFHRLGGVFADWKKLPAAAFCPGQVGFHCPSRLASALGRAGDTHSLARRVLSALGDGDDAQARQAFHAEYSLRESTPAGVLKLSLSIDSSAQRVRMRWEGPGVELEAVSKGEGGHLTRQGVEASELPRPGLDRLEAWASREPVVLVSAVVAGLVRARTRIVGCHLAAGCPAIRTEMPEGSVLELVLDPESAEPLELRCWWSADSENRSPDELQRLLAWRRVGGVRVASKVLVEPRRGGRRELILKSWVWH